MLCRRVEHRLLPIHKQITDARVDPSVPIKRLEVAEKTRGKIAVARTQFDNSQRLVGDRRMLILRGLVPLGHLFKIVNGQSMGEPVISGRKCLIKLADLIAAKTIEELVDMRLPLIDRFPIADQLG